MEYEAYRFRDILPRDGGSEAQDPRFWHDVNVIEAWIARVKHLKENTSNAQQLFGAGVSSFKDMTDG